MYECVQRKNNAGLVRRGTIMQAYGWDISGALGETIFKILVQRGRTSFEYMEKKNQRATGNSIILKISAQTLCLCVY